MSLYAVMKYNKVFSRAAALSPSIWFGRDKLEKLLHSARIKTDTVIYMDYGARELGYHPEMAGQFRHVTDLLLERGNKQLSRIWDITDLLLERKVDLTARIVPNGNHNEANWEKQLPFFMDVLLYDLEEQ